MIVAFFKSIPYHRMCTSLKADRWGDYNTGLPTVDWVKKASDFIREK